MFAVLGVLALGSVGDIAGATAATIEPKKALTSPYCGPRCVQRVLSEYDIEADLISLIQEIQFPTPSAGSSLTALSAALERRGIFARAVTIEPKLAGISWPHPVIVHVQNEGTGHYVVWTPSQSPHSSGHIWDSDATQVVLEPGAFQTARTGPVLLTSTSPIPGDARIGQVRESAENARVWGLSLLFGVAGFGTGWTIHMLAAPFFAGRSRDDTSSPNAQSPHG